MELKLSVTRFFLKPLEESERKLILSEQKGRCKACQIDIRKHNRMHKDTEDGKPYALCPVCYYSQHLEILPDNACGRMVLMPDIPQLELIVLTRTIAMMAKLNAEDYADEIDNSDLIKMLIEENHSQANQYYATGAAEVDLVAQVLSNQSDEDYAKRKEGLYGLRWIPDYSFFEEEIEYWYKTMLSSKKATYHPSKWEDLSKKIRAKVKNSKG